MKRKFILLNEVIAQAAVEEGQKLGLNASCEKVDDGYEISYASYDEPEDKEEKAYVSYDDMQYIMNEFSYQIKYMREDVAYMWKAFAEHKNGHLPPIKDAGVMKAALKSLGLADSYEVQKPTVWVYY